MFLSYILSLDKEIHMHKTHAKEFKPSVAWHKCNNYKIGEYKSEFDRRLLQIDPTNEVWSCKDYKCTKHGECI